MNSDAYHSDLIAELQQNYNLYNYSYKSITFAFSKDANLLELIIIGRLQKNKDVQRVEAINATHDLSSYDRTTGTLNFDALALSAFLAWAFRQKPKWKSFFDFRCYFEKFFNIYGDIDPHMITIAVATALGQPVLSAYAYHANMSLEQHPAEYAALYSGRPQYIGEINLS